MAAPARTVAATILVALTFGAAHASTASQPADLFKRQAAAFAARDWPALWSLYSPRFHAVCDHGSWLAVTRHARRTFPSAPRILIDHVRIRGNRAWVSYVWLWHKGQSLYVEDDLAVRIGGHWYDELDSNTTCGY